MATDRAVRLNRGFVFGAAALLVLLAAAFALRAAGPSGGRVTAGTDPQPGLGVLSSAAATNRPDEPTRIATAPFARPAAPTPTSQPANPPASLKVLSYNINRGMPRPDGVAQVILDAGADIVCLQETHARWERFLVPRLGRAYPHRVFRHAPGHDAAGLAVVSKYPFLLKAVVQPPGSWGPAMLIEARTRIGPVQVLNVHLRPGVDRRDRVTVRQVIDNYAHHGREIAGAFELARPAGPLIVLGDFNEGDAGGAIAWLVARNFTNALPRFDKASPTWHWVLPGGVLVEGRLDHVLHSPELDCLSARVIDIRVSDHMPVEAVLVARPANPTTAPEQTAADWPLRR